MSQTGFEGLARKVIDLLPRVRDASGLLRWGGSLLRARDAVLLRTGQDGVEVVAATRDEVGRWIADCPETRDWYSLCRSEEWSKDGVSLGRPFEGQGGMWADALVAFSRPGTPAQHRYELLFLAEAESPPYRSYDCWAAAVLLAEYNRATFADQLVEAEAERAQVTGQLVEAEAKRAQVIESFLNYSALGDCEVQPGEDWTKFAERIETAAKDWDAGTKRDFLLLRYAHWTAYEARPGSSARSPEKAPPAPVSPTPLIAFAGGLIRALRPAPGPDTSSEAAAPPGEAPREQESGVTARLLEAARELLIGPDLPKPPLGLTPGPRLALLTLEVGVRSALVGLQGPPSEWEGVLRRVPGLLDLARCAVSWLLTARGSGNRDVLPKGVPERGDLSREILRYYFVERIAAADRLRALLLPCKDPATPAASPDRPLEPRAPVVLRRAFAQSLLRYLAWMTGLMLTRLDLRADPRAVTPRVVLEAQIHLVDRYVHVELGVDERLALRSQLHAGLEAEVQHHLGGGGGRYRDHLLHVVDVFLLGDLLLRSSICWLGGKSGSFAEHLCELHVPASGAVAADCTEAVHSGQSFLACREPDWLRSWAVAALLHDTGYHYLWLSRLAERPGEPAPWHRYFHLPYPSPDDWLVPGEAPSNEFLVGLDRRLALAWPRWRSIVPTDGALVDHGVLSALRLAQRAFHLGGVDHDGDADRLALLGSLSLPLHAIAQHNQHGERVYLHQAPLACLLRLCDELQEWGRPRVDSEKLLYGLYLDLVDMPRAGTQQALERSDSLDRARTNVVFERKGNCGLLVVVDCSSAKPAGATQFEFTLRYRDDPDAGYDPVPVLLSKAWNLQHIDLSLDHHDGLRDLRWCVELQFPPRDGREGRTAYDDYGLFADEVRILPLLPSFGSLEQVRGAGMVRLEAVDDGRGGLLDRFGLVLCHAAVHTHRFGWLRGDPSHHLGRYFDLKRRGPG